MKDGETGGSLKEVDTNLVAALISSAKEVDMLEGMLEGEGEEEAAALGSVVFKT